MPVEGSDELKRTNEIGMAIPLLEGCDIAGKVVTAPTRLLTQRSLATYLISSGRRTISFTVKANQPTPESNIALLFEKRAAPDFVEVTPPDHGRIETRRIWCSAALNAYIDFPHVGQVFLVERGMSSRRKPASKRAKSPLASQVTRPNKLLRNRCWPSIAATGPSKASTTSSIWNFDEDRSRIRTGFGPENITRLRRFAVGILKSFQTSTQSIAELMRKLCFRTRLVFDYLRITKNSATGAPKI